MDDVGEVLLKGAKELGVNLTPIQKKQFFLYLELLLQWNRKINLTASKEAREIVIKHFLDSLTCRNLIASHPGSGRSLGEQKAIDLGSGAGFPGVPLKIVLPSLKLTLLDSLKKRTRFLRCLCQNLALEDTEIIAGRAEDWGGNREFREKFDLALSRAVARLNVLVELGLPFLRLGGTFLAQKGPRVEGEAEEASKALGLLGGRIKEIRKVKLPFLNQTRSLVIIEKEKPTPGKYPRRAGIPQKRPL
jgi:16S rRNA (guanine527-N7)-methyltransferase